MNMSKYRHSRSQTVFPGGTTAPQRDHHLSKLMHLLVLFPVLIFTLEITVLIRNSPERCHTPLRRGLCESFSRKTGAESEISRFGPLEKNEREGYGKGRRAGGTAVTWRQLCQWWCGSSLTSSVLSRNQGPHGVATRKQNLKFAFESIQERAGSFNINVKPHNIKTTTGEGYKTFVRKWTRFRWSCVGTGYFCYYDNMSY